MELIEFLLKGVNEMDKEIRRMLEEEIIREIRDLSNLQPGSNEKTEAVKALDTLYRLKEDEIQLKKEQLEEQIKDRYFKLGIEAAGIVLPLIFYGCWMKRGFAFEETGTYTSTTFRGLFSRFKPTRK